MQRCEGELISEMKTAVDALKQQMTRVKAEGVRDTVDKVAGLLGRYIKVKDELHAEWHARVEHAARSTAELEGNISSLVHATEDKIMGVLSAVSDKLAEHDRSLAKLTENGPDPVDEQPSAEWAKVVKRQRKPSTKPLAPAGLPTQPVKPPRARPMAILVKSGDKSFPALLKTVRQRVDPKDIGNSISKLREARSGGLLIEVNGGAESADVVRVAVKRSLDPGASVTKLEDLAAIELRDLDAMTTSEEVIESLSRESGARTARLVSIRKVYGGAQTAVVRLPATAAKRICLKERIRVGLVYARVRYTTVPRRCFRCLSFGHFHRDCKGDDRSRCCFRCGSKGHFAEKCSAEPDVIKAFRAVTGEPWKTGISENQAPKKDADHREDKSEFDRPRDVGQQNRDD